MTRKSFVIFACLLAPAVAHAASADLTWSPPTQNEDGSTPLDDLAGYNVYYYGETGNQTVPVSTYGGLPQPVVVPKGQLADDNNPATTISGFYTCDHVFFAVTARDYSNNESTDSNEADATLVDAPIVTLGPGTQADEMLVSWTGLDAGDLGTLGKYVVRWGTSAGVYTGSQDVNGATSLLLAGQPTNGSTVFVVVDATCADATVDRSTEVSAAPGYCGDGTANAGEACDDAGESSTCNDDCTTAACGDGTINTTAGETCDDAGESAACDDDCTAAECGDGTLNTSAGEQCDDNNIINGDGCSSTCLNQSANCGDGVVDSGEDCDDSGESATCDSDCTTAQCGDNALNVTAGELCDGNCPTSCSPPDACTTSTRVGSAGTCDAECQQSAITTCSGADGCCPGGCSFADDDDCPMTGGDGGNASGDPGSASALEGGCSCAASAVGLPWLAAALMTLRRRRGSAKRRLQI